MSINQYRKQAILGASPGQLIIMFYVEIEKSLESAIKDINTNDRMSHITRAIELISALLESIDGELGGDLLSPLKELYVHFVAVLAIANLNKDEVQVKYVLTHIQDLKETWKQAIELAKSAE